MTSFKGRPFKGLQNLKHSTLLILKTGHQNLQNNTALIPKKNIYSTNLAIRTDNKDARGSKNKENQAKNNGKPRKHMEIL